MSAIHVRQVVEALDRPSTLKSLSRKTGYPVGRVLDNIILARSYGHRICAHYRPNLPTYYERITE
jgi:extradiol dioxygenase family protein